MWIDYVWCFLSWYIFRFVCRRSTECDEWSNYSRKASKRSLSNNSIQHYKKNFLHGCISAVKSNGTSPTKLISISVYISGSLTSRARTAEDCFLFLFHISFQTRRDNSKILHRKESFVSLDRSSIFLEKWQGKFRAVCPPPHLSTEQSPSKLRFATGPGQVWIDAALGSRGVFCLLYRSTAALLSRRNRDYHRLLDLFWHSSVQHCCCVPSSDDNVVMMFEIHVMDRFSHDSFDCRT